MIRKVSGRYLPTLDGWRAVAILCVVFAHGIHSFSSSGIGTGILEKFEPVGLFGVQIFFAISGFLITSRLLDEEKENGAISIKGFYIRRVFRILPAALSFLIVAGLLSMLGAFPLTIGRWVSTLFFAANYSFAPGSWYLGHFWSLAVEEHFYFIWPAIFFVVRSSRNRLKTIVIFALILAVWRALDLRFGFTHVTPAYFWGRTDIQVDGILWGVLVALLAQVPKVWERLIGIVTRPLVWWSLLTAVLLLQIFGNLWWGYLVFALPAKAVLLPLVLLGTVGNPQGLPGRILETSPMRWLGRISYSLYLWQQLFLVAGDSVSTFMGPVQTLPWNYLLALSCAVLSYSFIERPLVKIGHKIAAKVGASPQK